MTEKNLEPQSPEEVFKHYHAEDKRKGEIMILEREISMAEHRIKKADAYLRLEKNADWKTVMEEGFMDEFAKNAIKGLGRGNIDKSELHAVLESVGTLQTHLEGLLQLANTAKMDLPKMKDELVRLKTAEIN